MKKLHTFTLTLLTLLILLSMNISTTTALDLNQGPSGNIDYENENIHMKITGNQNVPMYQFWSVDNTQDKYRVQFGQMFEAIDENNNGVYDLGTDRKVSGGSASLSSAEWEFSDTSNESDEVTFNMTTTSLGYELTFDNHIENNASSLKFDVIIDGYEFTSDADNAILVLGFSLSSTGTNAGNDTDGDSNQVQFGDAFFGVEETAQDADGDLSVGLSTGSSGNTNNAFIAYEKFNGTLVHDPTIGLEGTNTLLLVAGGVVVVLVIAAIIYNKKSE